jgi:hypothetical protein
LLKNAPILILDEATASVDTATERLIQQALEHLMTGRTSFVIAHRLSTIRKADQILVLEADCVMERGSHATLLAQDLAVAPILVTVTVLAALATTTGDLDPAAIGRALLTLAPAAGAVALLVVVGRLGLRPLFRSVAKSRSGGGGGRQELFVALCLLIVVGAGVAAAVVVSCIWFTLMLRTSEMPHHG